MHAFLVREPVRQRPGRELAAHLAQVVPATSGQVLDARCHLQPTASQVEVDDDGCRPRRGQAAPHGEGQGAGAEATGGPDHGDDGGCG